MKRVLARAKALRENDFDTFLHLVKESGRSSWMYVQNAIPAGAATYGGDPCAV